VSEGAGRGVGERDSTHARRFPERLRSNAALALVEQAQMRYSLGSSKVARERVRATLPPPRVAGRPAGTRSPIRAREQPEQRRTAAVNALRTMPGDGPITALPVVTFAPHMDRFRRERDVAASPGIVPEDRSTGGWQRLGKTSEMEQRDSGGGWGWGETS
jgi:hypothetical protein